jgi:hypothetical protein
MAVAPAAGAAFQTRTEIEVQAAPLQKQLSYGDGICLLGSCFSENMASRYAHVPQCTVVVQFALHTYSSSMLLALLHIRYYNTYYEVCDIHANLVQLLLLFACCIYSAG